MIDYPLKPVLFRSATSFPTNMKNRVSYAATPVKGGTRQHVEASHKKDSSHVL